MATLIWPGFNPALLNPARVQQAHNRFYPLYINVNPVNSEAANQKAGCINACLDAIRAEIHTNPVAANPNIGRGLTLRNEATVQEEQRDVCIASL